MHLFSRNLFPVNEIYGGLLEFALSEMEILNIPSVGMSVTYNVRAELLELSGSSKIVKTIIVFFSLNNDNTLEDKYLLIKNNCDSDVK